MSDTTPTTTVGDVYRVIDARAPFRWTKQVYPDDNVGLLAGRRSAPIKRVLCSLDISPETIREAEGLSAELIVSHHPLTFGLSSVTDDTAAGLHMLRLLEGGVAAICAHTNWDAAPGGVNDTLAGALGLTGPFEILGPAFTDADGRSFGLGRVGSLPKPISPRDFALSVAKALSCAGVRLKSGSRPVRRVAVCGGSGGSLWDAVLAKNCDTFVCGDVKHHQFIEAQSLDITLIDAGHFPTENIAVPALAQVIRDALPNLSVHVSSVTREPSDWIVFESP